MISLRADKNSFVIISDIINYKQQILKDCITFQFSVSCGMSYEINSMNG